MLADEDDFDVEGRAHRQERGLARRLVLEAVDGLRMASSLLHEEEVGATLSRHVDALTKLLRGWPEPPG